MHKLIKDELGLKEDGTDPISRASVIFFMKDLHKYGYSQMKKDTGKGGVHAKYNITMTKEQFTKKTFTDINNGLIKALEEMKLLN